MGYTFAWVHWEKIGKPTKWGGWGLKDIHNFARALVTKMGRQIITYESLWKEVVYYKYIHPLSIIDWIHRPDQYSSGASIIWKTIS